MQLIIIVLCNNLNSFDNAKERMKQSSSFSVSEQEKKLQLAGKVTVYNLLTAKNDKLCCVRKNIVKYHSEKKAKQ